jgi:hypothetical protein
MLVYEWKPTGAKRGCLECQQVSTFMCEASQKWNCWVPVSGGPRRLPRRGLGRLGEVFEAHSPALRRHSSKRVFIRYSCAASVLLSRVACQ